jgi:hypothetical protein
VLPRQINKVDDMFPSEKFKHFDSVLPKRLIHSLEALTYVIGLTNDEYKRDRLVDIRNKVQQYLEDAN